MPEIWTPRRTLEEKLSPGVGSENMPLGLCNGGVWDYSNSEALGKGQDKSATAHPSSGPGTKKEIFSAQIRRRQPDCITLLDPARVKLDGPLKQAIHAESWPPEDLATRFKSFSTRDRSPSTASMAPQSVPRFLLHDTSTSDHHLQRRLERQDIGDVQGRQFAETAAN